MGARASGYLKHMSAEAKYHRERIMFAVLNGELKVAVGDERSHIDWLREDYDIGPVEFETIVRGYVKSGRVVFYKGSEFSCISSETELPASLDLVFNYLCEHNHTGQYEVCNGVTVGEIGTVWAVAKIEGTIIV